jgi:hypothetical protein
MPNQLDFSLIRHIEQTKNFVSVATELEPENDEVPRSLQALAILKRQDRGSRNVRGFKASIDPSLLGSWVLAAND